MKMLSVVILASIMLPALFVSQVQAGVIRYTDSPGSFPSVTSALAGEFGTTSFPPLVETTQSFYRVEGAGPVDLKFRFKSDTGSFRFQFGYYQNTSTLRGIDLSTDAGRIAYATTALASATLVFDDRIDDPGSARTITATGGDELGFFIIPDDTLERFQTTPGLFAVEGIGSETFGFPAPFRWPLFGLADANPQGRDQLMSFSGISSVTGESTNLFAWEDLTRATILGNPQPSDVQFNDLIFTVEGIQAVAAVPEPTSLAIFSTICLVALGRRRKPIKQKGCQVPFI